MKAFIRPKPCESEDDVLKQQEEFLKEKCAPSVSVVNKRKQQETNVSKFAKTSRKKSKSQISLATDSVLGDIKEKVPVFTNWSFSHSTSVKGFPETFIADDILQDKRSSIFSQQLAVSSKIVKNAISRDMDSCGIQDNVKEAIGNRSYILNGNDAQEIHCENVKKLSEMSVDEILAEQKKLMESVDPKVLEFLLSRRKNKIINSESLEMDVTHSEGCESKSNSSVNNNKNKKYNRTNSLENPPERAILENDNSNKWVHMDVVEKEKLLWIGDIPPAKPVDSTLQYNARFDFQGMLLPYVSKDVDVRQALYHHGDEPQRPGYSIEELYQLSRSSVLQQRIIALNTIGNILDKVKKGYYDVCFNENLLPQLLDHELFLLLRFALDENTETQLTVTLFALQNLLCSEVDELCLDRAMGCRQSICQPNLYVMYKIPQDKENELKETETELKDFELLKVDIVKGALRTDIVSRIRYILEIIRPGPKTVISCLEILTRLARHSYDTTLAITCCPRLLQVIITNFVPKDWSKMVGDTKPSEMQCVYNVPLVEALKLLRIIACRSRKLASDLVHKYFIMDAVVSYISIDPKESSLPLREVLRLSLESFYVWQTMLTYNMATQHFIDMSAVLMRLLQFHYHATSIEENCSSFSYEHGTALISVIEQATVIAQFECINKKPTSRNLSFHHVKDFCCLLEMCLSKWLTQLGNTTNLEFSSMKLVGATFNCLTSLYNFHISQVEFDLVKWLNKLESFFDLQLLQALNSKGFQTAILNLIESSCLLFSGEAGSKRDTPALPSLGALMWKGQCLTPVLQPKSPFFFMSGLLNFMIFSYSIHKGLDLKCAKILLENKDFERYIKQINEEASAKLASHWFSRIEVRFLASVLKLTYVKDVYLDTVHQLAFKLIPLIQKDEKHLIKNIMNEIVFNESFFKNSSAICEKLAALNIESSQNHISREDLVLESCQEISSLWDCYRQCLNLDADKSINYSEIINLSASNHGMELFLPVDWPYLPIIQLQNQGKSEQNVTKESTSLIVSALKLILLVEELRPEIASTMNVTDRFCRLSTVFLSGSDLFLNPSIHELLHVCFGRLIKEHRKIKFPPSFYDLYTQLLEQFAAVSYGDRLFGQFILVPLQQRHSPDLRKQVWSEHAAVLRVLGTPLDQLMFPVNEMLEPCETDRSLLLTYLHCLAAGTIRENWSPVLFLVAVHHVATFINLYSETELAIHMKDLISKMGNKEMQSLLLNY